MKVCYWCARLTTKCMCPGCAAQGHLYRTLDDGTYGFVWMRERWIANHYTVGLKRLAKAEAAWQAARTQDTQP